MSTTTAKGTGTVKPYNEKIIDLANEAIKKTPEGRIGADAARHILSAAKDGGKYTDVEKATMEHLRTNFSWTPKRTNGSAPRSANGRQPPEW